MLHEEFTRLSKVETTTKFYEEYIEPLYLETDIDIDKEQFVERWLKDNKANIVKAHAFDISQANRELSLAKCKADELTKLKAENSQLQYQAETFEDKFKAANAELHLERKNADDLLNAYHEEKEKFESSGKGFESILIENETLKAEILKLKARLFDMMENGAA